MQDLAAMPAAPLYFYWLTMPMKLLNPDSHIFEHTDKITNNKSIIETRDTYIDNWLLYRNDIVGTFNYYEIPYIFSPKNNRYFVLILSDADTKHAQYCIDRFNGFWFNKKLKINLKAIVINKLIYNDESYKYYLDLYSCKMSVNNILINDHIKFQFNSVSLTNILAQAAKLYKKYTKGTQNYNYNVEAIYFGEEKSIANFTTYFSIFSYKKDSLVQNLQQYTSTSQSLIQDYKELSITPVKTVPNQFTLSHPPIKKIQEPKIEEPTVLSSLTTRLKLIDL